MKLNPNSIVKKVYL